jgi:hypothetical protein
VFVDLQRPAATASDGAFFFSLSSAIARDAQPYHLILPPPERARFEGSPFEAFEGWLEQALPKLQDYHVLLAFDEFEKVNQAFKAGKLSLSVLDQIRYLIQHQAKLALLFAGVQTLDELGPDWSSYFINVRARRWLG